MLKPTIELVAATLAAATSSFANDSSAELATGGLIFIRNENVEMRSEDLTISAKEISVRYRFFNKSDKDVTVLVAFRCPRSRSRAGRQLLAPDRGPVNLLAFTTVVNGRPAPARSSSAPRGRPRSHQRCATSAYLLLLTAGHQRGARQAAARQMGRPASRRLPMSSNTTSARAWRTTSSRAGSCRPRSTGSRRSRQARPWWSTATSRASARRCRPRSGRRPPSGGLVRGLQGKYCLDKEFYTAVERTRREARSQYGALARRIEYILKTGANWSGPIKEFRLVIDKGDASSLVSFCGDGIKKISPTQFEMKKTDFTPDSDLSVLILKRLAK